MQPHKQVLLKPLRPPPTSGTNLDKTSSTLPPPIPPRTSSSVGPPLPPRYPGTAPAATQQPAAGVAKSDPFYQNTPQSSLPFARSLPPLQLSQVYPLTTTGGQDSVTLPPHPPLTPTSDPFPSTLSVSSITLLVPRIAPILQLLILILV